MSEFVGIAEPLPEVARPQLDDHSQTRSAVIRAGAPGLEQGREAAALQGDRLSAAVRRGAVPRHRE